MIIAITAGITSGIVVVIFSKLIERYTKPNRYTRYLLNLRSKMYKEKYGKHPTEKEWKETIRKYKYLDDINEISKVMGAYLKICNRHREMNK